MKKQNNKGFTLIELIVAIALFVITMLAAHGFINYLMHVRTSPSMAYANQTTRALIIDTIQNDWLTHGITSNAFIPSRFADNNCLPLAQPCIRFIFYSHDRRATLIFNRESLHYQTFLGIRHTWNFRGGTSYVPASGWLANTPAGNCELRNAFHCSEIFRVNNLDYIFLQIRIPIHNGNPRNSITHNNINDDIVLTYYGRRVS